MSSTLTLSIGFFTGLVFAWLARGSVRIQGVLVDALLGAAGAALVTWLASPLTQGTLGAASLNVADILASILGASVLLALSRVVVSD